MEPREKRRMARERRRFPGQIDEDHLRHVLREMVITAELAQSGGVDKINLPSHQFGERDLGSVGGVLGEEC